jgi:DNA repair protein RecN (Recombination protein N)
MLLELRVENYAVIDQVAVEFAPGLNLLTGETGAGKSILIDALALLLGDKASTDVIRHGAEKAAISCVFEIDGASAKRIAHTLEENGIDSEDGQLILRREISTSGKGRVFVNNQPASVAVLRQLAPDLASIHAQNETILAFDASARLEILDSYAGVTTEKVEETFQRVRDLRIRIADLERDEQDRLRLVDLWSFQAKEIEAAKLQPGEDSKLEAEKRVLANSEKLYSAAMSSYDALYDGAANANALIKSAERQLEELARYDEKFSEQAAALASARATVEDISATVRDYAEGIDASPERLAEIEDRLATIDRLKRKYGNTVEEIITFGDEVRRKLSEVENRDQVLTDLRKELTAASNEYLREARAISKQRFDAAKKLEKLVETEINSLAMKAKFKIEVGGSDEEGNWTSSGFDSVAYMIATNTGDPLQPIERIASGGELSRVMLALKATVDSSVGAGVSPAQRGSNARVEAGAPARHVGARPASPAQDYDHVKGRPFRVAENGSNKTGASARASHTMVFDEIDTGIGGRAAEAVGKKLKELARNNQVLCITHLPQIASFADHHLVIEKRESAGRTRTSIRTLAEEERTEEIARMLSGAQITQASLKNAEQLLKANA